MIMNANGMLKVYFTHDRRVYVETAKHKHATTTTTEYKGDCKPFEQVKVYL